MNSIKHQSRHKIRRAAEILAQLPAVRKDTNFLVQLEKFLPFIFRDGFNQYEK